MVIKGILAGSLDYSSYAFSHMLALEMLEWLLVEGED